MMQTTPFDSILDDLASQGWSLVADFIPPETVACLAGEARALQQAQALNPAGIGKGGAHLLNSEIRGDSILWLEEATLSQAQRTYLNVLEELRLAVNAGLQLGLFEFEGHLAVYPPGSFYRKHLDRFRNDSQRTLTCILYLNEDWQAGEGGQLRVYTAEHAWFDVEPQGGSLFTFLADRFWHEVLPASRERLSLTGWFKTRGERP